MGHTYELIGSLLIDLSLLNEPFRPRGTNLVSQVCKVTSEVTWAYIVSEQVSTEPYLNNAYQMVFEI